LFIFIQNILYTITFLQRSKPSNHHNTPAAKIQHYFSTDD
jgi:hypothetical protein